MRMNVLLIVWCRRGYSCDRQQVLLEYQRDWSRKETYDAVMGLVQEHSGAYGMGVDYAYTMVHKTPQRVIK